MIASKNQKTKGKHDEIAGAFVEMAFTNAEIERAVALEGRLGMRDGGPCDGCEFLDGPVGKVVDALPG